MSVYKARAYLLALQVDDLVRLAPEVLSDLQYPVVLDKHIAGIRPCAGSVIDSSAFKQRLHYLPPRSAYGVCLSLFQ